MPISPLLNKRKSRYLNIPIRQNDCLYMRIEVFKGNAEMIDFYIFLDRRF